MVTDAPLRHAEMRARVKCALLSYDGAPVHVTIYCLRQVLPWNELLATLSRHGQLARADRVARICEAVDRHLRQSLGQ